MTSRHQRRRIAVLLGVHVLFLVHLAHYWYAGRTLSPVEPSEAMYTIENGELNCGFVFFVLAIAATALFGRFFCGWGCHIVALQDLSRGLLRRLGVRPRPLRSRLLPMVPFAVAGYMFVWPSLRRAWLGSADGGSPGLHTRFLTSDFWATFPGPVVALATLVVCGFAIVYVLGAKGFCTYACPYGALFRAADKLAPLTVAASSACTGCGVCTSACSSNVPVAAEVARHSRVVDSGCMKCGDCIDACPESALAYGLRRPSLLVPAARRRYDLSFNEEVVAVVVLVVTTLALRGLYGVFPLLLTVALAAIASALAVTMVRLGTKPYVELAGAVIRGRSGLTTAGRVVVAVSALAFGLVAHSALVQWDLTFGRYHLSRTGCTLDELLTTPPEARERGRMEHVRGLLGHFERVDAVGLRPSVEVKLGLAWARLLQGRHDLAEAHLAEAVDLQPEDRSLQHLHAQVVAWRSASRGSRNDGVSGVDDRAIVEPG